MSDIQDQHQSELRDEDQIIFAHDLVDKFLSGQLPVAPAEDDHKLWLGIQICLCWVLQHNFGNNLTDNLVGILQMSQTQGYEFIKVVDLRGNGRGIKNPPDLGD